jgi:hypothetical protein
LSVGILSVGYVTAGQIAHEAAAGKAAAAAAELKRKEEFVALYQAAQSGEAMQ